MWKYFAISLFVFRIIEKTCIDTTILHHIKHRWSIYVVILVVVYSWNWKRKKHKMRVFSLVNRTWFTSHSSWENDCYSQGGLDLHVTVTMLETTCRHRPPYVTLVMLLMYIQSSRGSVDIFIENSQTQTQCGYKTRKERIPHYFKYSMRENFDSIQ